MLDHGNSRSRHHNRRNGRHVRHANRVSSASDDVNGIPVVLLDDSEGDGTLAIQTVGEPYPVQIAGNDQGESGVITFSDWNAPVSVTAPTP